MVNVVIVFFKKKFFKYASNHIYFFNMVLIALQIKERECALNHIKGGNMELIKYFKYSISVWPFGLPVHFLHAIAH